MAAKYILKRDYIMKDTGQYFTSDSAEDTFCRLYGQVRQLYYLDLDRENDVPVDREQLESIVNSILYIALDTEKKITDNSIPGHIENMKMETRGGVIQIYRELAKNLKESYRALRSYARKRIAKNQK